MSTQYGFSFIKDRCVQCHGCVVACKSWRNAEPGINRRRVYNIWSGQYPEVKMATASVSCMHCADPVCVKACPAKALTKRREDGIVLVDREKCIGCRTCEKECPFGAPQFGADGKMQKCDMCLGEIDLTKELPPCVETCPTKAVRLVKMDEKEKTGIERSIREMIKQSS